MTLILCHVSFRLLTGIPSGDHAVFPWRPFHCFCVQKCVFVLNLCLSGVRCSGQVPAVPPSTRGLLHRCQGNISVLNLGFSYYCKPETKNDLTIKWNLYEWRKVNFKIKKIFKKCESPIDINAWFWELPEFPLGLRSPWGHVSVHGV